MAASEAFEEPELQEILEAVAGENGFEKPKYEVSAATKAGDNYVGRVLRAVIHETGPKKRDPLSLIFKSSPVSKARREAFRSGIIYRNEGNMYTIVLPALHAFLKEHGLSDGETFPNSARCLSLKLSEDSSENALDVLVLEDMKARGYEMVERSVGLDAENCRMILQRLARLHGSSLALRHLRPAEAAELESNIREVAFEKDNPLISDLQPMVSKSLAFVEDRYPEGSPEHTKLKNFVDNYIEECLYFVKPNDKLSCVTHGDCWSNNVLFKFDKKDGKLQNICLIDFQISRVASPVLDIVYLLFTCTTKKTRDEHYQSLLQSYHDSLCSTLNDFGCDPQTIVPWSLFEEQLKTYGRYGLGMALITTQLFLADSSEVPDIDAMMDKGDSIFDVFGNISTKKLLEVKERVSDALQDAIKFGYL